MRKITLKTAAAITALAAASSAHAQTQAQVQTSEAALVDGVEEITVTAQRREQSVQDVPIAVSAFSDLELQRRQVTETYDLLRNIPNMAGNLNVGVGTSASYFLRAVGNGESIATFDVPVGTYVDDVYMARQNSNNFALFDVERIEVLRGPQGTLFGRNTTGGAINIIMRKPGRDFGGFAEAGYGRFDQVLLRGSLDLPVSDTVLSKISGFRITDDGYATQASTGRGFNSRDTWGVRGMLRFLPSDMLTVDLTVDHVDDQNTNFLNVIGADGDRVVNNRLIQGALAPLFVGRKGSFPIDNIAVSSSATANVAIDFGAATLNLITGYRRIDQEFIIDSGGELPRVTRTTGFNPIANDSEHRQFSQEIKLDGTTAGDRLTYVVGAYYLNEENVTDFAQAATNTVTGVQTVTADRTLKNDLDTYAAYTQGDFEILEGLTATAGIRYTLEEKSLAVQTNPGALGVQLSTAGIVAAGNPTRLRNSAWTPRFALSYDVSDDIMVFVSATRGFKSGGWPGRSVSNAGFVSFEPETVWSYETGLRSDLFDRRLRFNATGFYAKTYDIQIPAQIATATGPVSSTTNPADLKNYGLELDAVLVPAEGLTFAGSLGLQRASYVNIDPIVQAQQARCRGNITVAGLPGCNANFVDRLGNIARPIRAPRMTASGSINYDADFGFATVSPNVSVQYTSPYAIGTAGSPDQIDGSWSGGSQTYVNAALALRPAAIEGLSITAECKNCFGKDYPVSYIPVFQFLDRPGTWMLRARYSF
jgi:iron complex outermembrane receptor protein